MIDIHSHLLYGIDDGSKSIEESVSILKDLYRVGITDIILTPHYIKDSQYTSSRKNNLIILDNLKKELQKKNIPINLFLGNEIYIDEDIYGLLQKGIISGLNNTKYLLIEIPMSGEHTTYIDIFRDLINKGYHVILAHPERYLAFQKDFNKVYELEKMGVYFQSNIGSLVGDYGENAEKMVKRLLKEKKIAFFATDIHHKKHDYGKWERAKKVARKYISEKELKRLLIDNPSQLLD